MKPALLFYIPALAGGGIERVVSLLARGLADDYRVYVLPQIYDKNYCREHGTEAYTLIPGFAFPILGRNIFLGLHVLKLVYEVMKYRPDVIISAYPRVHLTVAVALRLLPSHVRPKWIASEHGDPDVYLGKTPWKRGLKLRFLRSTLKSAHLCFAVSEFVRRKAESLYGLSFRVIRNPVEIVMDENRRETPSEPSGVTILSMGRLEGVKGFDVLIRAFSRVLRRFPHARLIILGEGLERPRLERLVRTLDIEANVQLPGFVSNPWSYFQTATLFAFPSFSEGQPLAVVEAMLAGLPVVASDLDALREIGDDACMVFVPPGDIDALAEKMTFLLANPEVRVKLGANAQRRARSIFSEKTAIEEYKDTIREVLKGGIKQAPSKVL